jgi:hypothetical protein
VMFTKISFFSELLRSVVSFVFQLIFRPFVLFFFLGINHTLTKSYDLLVVFLKLNIEKFFFSTLVIFIIMEYILIF